MENNLIFVGDNLRVMCSEEFSKFKGKVNFIYIDPPYNTKSVFSYRDNSDCWGRDIYERLLLAKECLSEKGVIFISIDDAELSSLISICHDVFGEKNYVGLFVTKQSQRSNAKHINTVHEYVVCFAKDKNLLPKFYINRIDTPLERPRIMNIISKVSKACGVSKSEGEKELRKLIDRYVRDTGLTWIKNYAQIDNLGRIYYAKDLSTPGKPGRLDIDEIDLHLEPLKTRGWSSKEKILSLYKEERLIFKNGRPYQIEYIEEAIDNVSSILDFYSRQGTNDLKKLGLDDLFDTPKPVELIKFLIRASQHENSLILDFYAGSGTTAQAVYEVNKEDFMHHKYILIQLNEKISSKSTSYKIMKDLGYDDPRVSDAMVVRIDKFLESKGMEKDYVVKESKNEV